MNRQQNAVPAIAVYQQISKSPSQSERRPARIPAPAHERQPVKAPAGIPRRTRTTPLSHYGAIHQSQATVAPLLLPHR